VFPPTSSSTATKKSKPPKPKSSPAIQDLDLVPTRIPKPSIPDVSLPESPQITLKYKPSPLRLENPIPEDFNSSSSEVDSERFVLIGASVGREGRAIDSKGDDFFLKGVNACGPVMDHDL